MKPLTLKEAYAVIRECLNEVRPSNKKLSPAMRNRLDYTIHFLNAFVQLQDDRTTDIDAIGFTVEDDKDEDDEEDGGYFEECEADTE